MKLHCDLPSTRVSWLWIYLPTTIALLSCILLVKTQTICYSIISFCSNMQSYQYRKTSDALQQTHAAQLDSTAAQSQFTQNDAQLIHAINQEATMTPRFLYRTWRKGHASDQAIDTKDSVTPTMFRNVGRGKRSIYDFPASDLAEIARSDLNRESQVGSYFSSWTQSWQCMSNYLRTQLNHSGALDDVHISIIDTKLLEKRNAVVLHSSFFQRLNNTITANEEEYVAFGTISGHGYKTVSLRQVIDSNALLKISVGPWPHYTDLNEAIEGAMLFGECFGKYYALPIAATILSFPNDRLRYSWSGLYSRSFQRVVAALPSTTFRESGLETSRQASTRHMQPLTPNEQIASLPR